jgi:ubiquinone/menaquinone biosynthesis C-methylase UbiE
MKAEAAVAAHYGKAGLEERILQATARAGIDLQNIKAVDLAPVDEFHVGGLDATTELADRMQVGAGMRLLDVGSGIGGPARYFASERGCQVTGIDLTDEFVQVAKSLTRMVGLENAAQFEVASALKLPFPDDSFDGAYLIHVGMNLADKAGVFREVRRVVKDGGVFAVFDFMQVSNQPLAYPVPWAATAETSFVDTVENYGKALTESGFRVDKQRDRREFAIEFIKRMTARMAGGGPPVLGLHLLIGEQAPITMKNVLAMTEQGVLAPVEMIARAI